MAKYREPVPIKVKEAVLDRDGRACKKCGRRTNLHVHHIVMHMDGGSDEPDNLITLCGPCHAEHHALDDYFDIPFARWLTLPPYAVLVGIFLADWPEEIPSKELKATLLQLGKLLESRHDPLSPLWASFGSPSHVSQHK